MRPERLQRDLERELAFHIAEQTEEQRELGLSETEAVRTARLRFGNFTRHVERTREMDIYMVLESLVRNVRFGVRALAKTPAFTATVVLTHALGIGANSAVFSAIYAVLLRPLPYPHAGELVKLTQSQPKIPDGFVAPVRLEEWNRLNTALQGITGYYVEDASETSGELPEKVKRAWVAPRFLEVMGIAPELGRDFSPQEMRYGGPVAVLISHRLWQRRFGGNVNVLGQKLRIAPSSFVIVGVMPPWFRFPDGDVDLWSTTPPDAPYAQNRENTWYTGIGRMKPGVSLAEARANLTAVQADLGRQFPKTDATKSVLIEALKEATVGGIGRSLWLLFGSVSLLLLIACTNITALLLSRAAGREHETSVRYSLGASQLSMASEILTEVSILAVTGALAGLVLAAAASRVFRALSSDLPRVDEIGLNGAIVLYSLVCAVFVTLVCGLVPVLRSGYRDLSAGLGRGGRSSVAGHNPMLLLVGLQVALAVILLTGAGLLVRSFQELGRVLPGFDPQHVLTFHISNTWAEAPESPPGNGRRGFWTACDRCPASKPPPRRSVFPEYPGRTRLS